MYGMLLESVQYYVQQRYGRANWTQILEHSGIKNVVFRTHAVYSDDTMPKLASSCAEVLRDKSKEEFLRYFGHCFVLFFSNYGYDKIVRVSGRQYRDFLHEIDNLHEMMRYSYNKMRSPSFLVVSEDPNGCILSYRSTRCGFENYVIGQLSEVARKFYSIDVCIRTLTKEQLSSGYHVTFRLDFDNSSYARRVVSPTLELSSDGFGKLSSDIFFKVSQALLV